MTLFKQLFLGASLLFLLLLAGVEAIYLTNARHYMQQQLESRAEDAATNLGLWLALLKPFDDRARIEAVVNTAFDRDDYQSIRVVSRQGRTLLEKSLAAADDAVPQWFAQLLPLHDRAAESLISADGRDLGHVFVVSRTHSAYRQLWSTATQTLLLLLVVYVFALIALRAFLRNVLRPVDEIERAAIAIGEREFKTLQVAPHARELGRVVAAMNSLSSKIKRMIEDEAARAESLKREAYLDAVTGLLNRRGIEHDLHALGRADRDVFSGAFVLIQMEGLKEYNLRHGFQQADELLALIAQVIVGTGKSNAVVNARIGGASFAVLAPNVEVPAARVLADTLTARIVAMLIEQNLAHELTLHCGAVHFEAGVPVLPDLLTAADLALTRAQAQGPGNYELVELNQLDRRGRGSRAWREHIESAVDRGGLTLYAQSVISLPQREILQDEVVTRLVEDGAAPLVAAQFLPMAARHRLMARLDCRVLGMLIARIDSGAKLAPVIAVNVSAQTVADAASCRQIIGALQERRDIAKRLVFEMTEFGVIQEPNASMGFATEVRLLGAQFAIDHFNLHRDSLRRLHYLLPHYIKLAPTYTNELTQNQDSRFIVSSLIRIAQPLEIEIIAQAVESEAMIQLLHDMGFAGFQGYASGRPHPLG